MYNPVIAKIYELFANSYTKYPEGTYQMAEEKFKQVNVKESVKQDVGLLANIERRHEYEIVADAVKLYKALYHGDSSKKLRKAVESLPETELIFFR